MAKTPPKPTPKPSPSPKPAPTTPKPSPSTPPSPSSPPPSSSGKEEVTPFDPNEEVDPKFSKRSAAVINSKFWTDISALQPDPETGEEALDDVEQRKADIAMMDMLFKHKDVMEEALLTARRYEDLPTNAKALFNEVEQYNAGKVQGSKKDIETGKKTGVDAPAKSK